MYTSRWAPWCTAAVAATLVLVPLTASADPSQDAPPPGCDIGWTTYTGASDRVRVETIGEHRVDVLVPPGYDRDTRRYPSVYMIPGSFNTPGAYLELTDLIDFSAQSVPPAIYVMPSGPWTNTWIDWRDGSNQDDTFFARTIVPTIDARYRTEADRSHRAIAGFSGGGLGAAHLASTHPDLFGAMATLSGAAGGLSWPPPIVGSVVMGSFLNGVDWYCNGDRTTPIGEFGGPLDRELWTRNASPSDLAPNVSGMDLHLYTGNGVPCDADPRAVAEVPTGPLGLTEPIILAWTEAYARALHDAHADHRLTEFSCGVHQYYDVVVRELHDWLPSLASVFGSPPPASFDYRRADSTISVWGWNFAADPARAAEFLDITDASCRGVTLTGSGTEAVTTAPCFPPHARVAISGGDVVTADRDGRVHLTVDLGPPHTDQQYTAPAVAAEALAGPNYWVTRRVTFTRTS